MITGSSRRYVTYRDRGRGGRWSRYVGFVVALFLVYLTIHTLFLQTIRHDSVTMVPALERGDRLFLSPLSYGPRIPALGWILPGLTGPRRGDLVAVRPGFMREASPLQRLANPLVRFATLERLRLDDGGEWRSALQVKRIIGLPEDTIRMERFIAYVRPLGQNNFDTEFELSDSSYSISREGLPDGWLGVDPFSDAMDEIVLGPDEYFIIGDNRAVSIDSRHWGPVNLQAIHALVVFRYWPFRRIGTP